MSQLPSITELHHDIQLAFKNDALNALLNSPPPKSFIKQHPFINVEIPHPETGQKIKVPLEYIPVDKVKFLLTRIFQEWSSQVIEFKQLFNAVSVQVRLTVKSPITGQMIIHDGVGAVGVQTDKGASASDLNAIKQDAVMKALPAAESYALKNAAEKLGILFGSGLQKNVQDFSPMYYKDSIEYDDLYALFDLKKEALSESDRVSAQRVLNNKEIASYKKLHDKLQSL